MTDLDTIIAEFDEAYAAYIDADEKASLLDGEHQKNFLDGLMINLEILEIEAGRDNISEAKLLRLARGSEAYKSYCIGVTLAQIDRRAAKFKCDSLDKKFEARRSMMALERAKIEKGIFGMGKG